MKKSIEIIGLPVISITEGRELGMSKTLLIDAKNGTIAAITIEDEDWYRGVKLLPYSSVIAIGEDAVTVTNSENILTLEDAGDYEAMMDANIKIIGTKAITKSGTIQGKVVEIYVGDNGKIEKCEIEARDGSLSEITSDQISIFGKQVTVIDSDLEKKTELIAPKAPAEAVAAPKAEEKPAAEPKAEAPKAEPAKAEAPKAEPKQEAKPAEPKAAPAPAPAPKAEPKQEAKPAPKAEPAKAEAPKADPSIQMADKATEERHRRFLLGKTVTRKITTDSGVVLVNEGDTVTEEVLQKVKIANKFIDLSMNVQKGSPGALNIDRQRAAYPARVAALFVFHISCTLCCISALYSLLLTAYNSATHCPMTKKFAVALQRTVPSSSLISVSQTRVFLPLCRICPVAVRCAPSLAALRKKLFMDWVTTFLFTDKQVAPMAVSARLISAPP